VTYDAPIRARDAAVGRRADAGTNLGPVATSDAAPEPARDALVDLHTVDDSIELDIRYATTNNFTKTAVYPVARCRLRYAVATRLVAVHRALSDAGYALKIWDCYRPISVQQAFWKLVPDSRYVAEPVIENGKAVKGSKHNRGAAVDLTLVDAKGAPVEMPTDYDDFSEKAHRDADATDAAKRHRKILRDAMEAQGFSALPTEWWHFDGPDWRTYALSDEPL
jgi:beta-N-acetylhexosaminidase/D-alanyl-D-alanine dipeptidase